MKNNNVLVTACCMACNAAADLRESLLSLFSQTYANMEVLLLDDGSTDETARIFEEMAQKHAGERKVTIYKRDKNAGIAANVNWFFEHAKGELLVFFDSDDISLPIRVEVLVDAWDRNARTWACSSAVTAFKRCDRGNGVMDIVLTGEGYSYDKERVTYAISPWRFLGTSKAIAKAQYEFFGKIPEDKPFLWEDATLFQRALITTGVLLIPEKLVRYRVGRVGSVTSAVRWRKKYDQLCRDTERCLSDDIHFLDNMDKVLCCYPNCNRVLVDELRDLISQGVNILKLRKSILMGGGGERYRAFLKGFRLFSKRELLIYFLFFLPGIRNFFGWHKSQR